MSDIITADPTAGEAEEFEKIVNLLGGKRVLRRPPHDRMEVHSLLMKGLPAKACAVLWESMDDLRQSSDALEQAIGMSVRTVQRRKEQPSRLLSPEQSSRLWKLAEVIARATEVFGSRKRAEQWMLEPAIGLDRKRPIELLGSAVGTELVEDYLTQIEYGVYV